MSWDELLDRGNEPFELYFSSVHGNRPSLTLRATLLHPCDNPDDDAPFQFISKCEIARDTDAGHARFATYMTSDTDSHLNDAVEHFQLVLDQCPVGHLDRATALTNLACARLEGYLHDRFQDIDTTISLFRDALELRREVYHHDHLLSLYYLAQALVRRYSKKNTAADICEAAQHYCELLRLCPGNTYLRGIAKIDFNHVIRQCNSLPIIASDEDIALRQIVLGLCPLDCPHRPRTLAILSEVLATRFTRCGSIDDIDECIRLLREASSLSFMEDCPNKLAHSLLSRFYHQGQSYDLDKAISVNEEALCLHPVGHKFRSVSLSHLGGALVARFNRRGDIDDINRAISLHREELSLDSPHPPHDTTFNNLALALKTRYDKLRVMEDLNEAINWYRKSLESKYHGHPERHITLHNLSSALRSRVTQTQQNEDVEEAIQLCQQSLATLPPLHPDRWFSYRWLSDAYLSRYEMQHNPSDLSLVAENSRLASRHATQGFPQRIMTAWNWVCAAEKHDHPTALEAYTTFLEFLDSHLATRSSVISQREAAAPFRYAMSLPVDAASYTIRQGNLRHAVELVEQGRGQQWSLASRLRIPLEDLESANPMLAHRFSELSERLSDAEGSARSTNIATADQAATENRKLQEQWGGVVAEIRNLEGFSRFLLPPSYTDLQAAACHGPVIIFIASKYSCSAIIVPTTGEPHHVRFSSGVTLTYLEKLKNNFAKGIRQASFMGPGKMRKDLIVLLRTVWDQIMLPIVTVLRRDLRLQHRSRIWLCPTAIFTSIPLHAANCFRERGGNSGPEPSLEDLYICSYTPTLSALIRSRSMVNTYVTPSFVAVGQSRPCAGQGEVLLTIESELELVRELVPATANPTTLCGDDATRAGTLQALQQNTWVHLACHGQQDCEQPYNSGFAMRDEPLTLLDIMEKHIPHAEFAFLSACHTAVGNEETPDEVIHLAAGLPGFKSVIGTLWVVDDAVAKHVVEAFYENMFDGGVMDCTKAARALNHATRAVKAKVPLEQRIVFIHIGV
ncbi:CHAT domain-containing protein [Suillus lakei]|nr:CHAT domain-containing protein [Suillus lakei]